MTLMIKLTYGVGINDADYKLRVVKELPKIGGKRQRKLVWECPYFRKWKDMLKRVYSLKELKRNPSYKDVTVCEEWLTFSKFKQWVDSLGIEGWEGMHLDKDLLCQGGKSYNPECCAFITKETNLFIRESVHRRGDYLIGVSYRSDCPNAPYFARCGNPVKGASDFINSFSSEEAAHLAWRSTKRKYLEPLLIKEKDARVKSALIALYK